MGYLQLIEPVTAQVLAQREFEVEVAGRAIAAQVSLKPYDDPANLRIRS